MRNLDLTWLHPRRNIIHGSDTVENAQKEISLWFAANEVTQWTPAQTSWLYE
jgi:nucleoside-diphosphate kinase